MNINKMKKEDLELMSYNDITNLLLENKTGQTTAELFKQIVDLLELGEKVYENKISNYYTSLSTDKRFILLSDGKWDLKKNHKTDKVVVDEDDEIEDITEDSDYDDLVEEEEEEENKYLNDSEEDDDSDDVTDEYKNLVIVDEEDFDREQ